MQKIKFNSEKEWLDERKKYIGASDASIIMEVSKWKLPDGRIKTPYLLWKEKLGLDDLSCDSPATRYGKVMEEPARLVYQEQVGDIFEPICVKNEKYPHLMVSLDGLNVMEDRAVEIKNGNKEDHERARQGIIPEKYIPQVQMQILVTELPFIDYFSFHDGEGITVRVERDEKYLKILEEKLMKFWVCVEELKEPPLTKNDYIERNIEWEECATLLHIVQTQRKKIVEEEKELEKNLQELSEDNNSRCGLYHYTRSVAPGRVSYKSIPDLLNLNLDEFRGDPIISWRLNKTKG